MVGQCNVIEELLLEEGKELWLREWWQWECWVGSNLLILTLIILVLGSLAVSTLCLDFCSPDTNRLDGDMPPALHGPKCCAVTYRHLMLFTLVVLLRQWIEDS